LCQLRAKIRAMQPTLSGIAGRCEYSNLKRIDHTN
jgi:hypothetical protein